MLNESWFEGVPVAITICDDKGIIINMNDKACSMFAKYGGKDLIGRNVLDCHPEPARNKLKKMLNSQTSNCYTIEKNGVKKMIYKTPWYQNKEYKGFVEIIMEIPSQITHFIR